MRKTLLISSVALLTLLASSVSAQSCRDVELKSRSCCGEALFFFLCKGTVSSESKSCIDACEQLWCCDFIIGAACVDDCGIEAQSRTSDPASVAGRRILVILLSCGDRYEPGILVRPVMLESRSQLN